MVMKLDFWIPGSTKKILTPYKSCLKRFHKNIRPNYLRSMWMYLGRII